MVELGLYVHWPWCVRKCPYCDFNSRACRGPAPEAAYIEALLRDLETAAADAPGRPVTTVYIGGGTPSLISAQGMQRLLDGIRGRVELAPGAEISMEANPGTADAERFAAYAAAGVNRFSLGIQSFRDDALRVLGRIHDRRQALEAVRMASSACSNVNLDVMYALPGETPQTLEEDIAQALSAGVPHLSFYELTLEEGTAFAKHPPEGLPDDDLAADLADLVHGRLAEAGYEHYEVSGYAKPGRRCRHNLGYWTFGDYLGIGAGAHGKITREGRVERTVRSESPARWMQEAAEGRGAARRRVVSPGELPFEFALNALRLTEGVPASRWEETTGRPLSDIEPVLARLRSQGLLAADSSRIAATELGQRFLSDVQEAFLPGELS